MLWLVEYAPKSPKYQIINFDRVTAINLSEVAKIILNLNFLSKERGNIILKLLFVTQKQVFRKKTKRMKKKSKNVLYLILGALVSRARPKIW